MEPTEDVYRSLAFTTDDPVIFHALDCCSGTAQVELAPTWDDSWTLQVTLRHHSTCEVWRFIPIIQNVAKTRGSVG